MYWSLAEVRHTGQDNQQSQRTYYLGNIIQPLPVQLRGSLKEGRGVLPQNCWMAEIYRCSLRHLPFLFPSSSLIQSIPTAASPPLLPGGPLPTSHIPQGYCSSISLQKRGTVPVISTKRGNISCWILQPSLFHSHTVKCSFLPIDLDFQSSRPQSFSTHTSLVTFSSISS